MSSRKILLGIDPGLADLGWGIIEVNHSQMTPVDYNVIKTKSTLALPERLGIIYHELRKILTKYKPDEVGVEKLFFGKNVKTAMVVGEARGVVMLALNLHNLQPEEFTPPAIKIALTGYGNADKKQMQEMVKHTLKLEKIPKPDDVADALAVAITLAASNKTKTVLQNALAKHAVAKAAFYQRINTSQK